MNHRTDHAADQFDIWLDAYVAGMSTPASRAASDSVPGDLRDAARQFHGLAHGADDSPTVPSFTSTWEDFMNVQQVGTAADLVSARSAAPTLPRRAPYRGSGWHVALNVALAALLIVVIGTGVWRATDGFNGGDFGGDRQTGFAPETRVWTPESSEATPEPEVERALLPSAEECTVEPLTVDDVLWYIDDPIGATMSRDMNEAATPDVEVESDSPPPTISGIDDSASIVVATPPDPLVASPPPMFTPGPASAEQLAAVAEVQRMWMACVRAESPFQRWALESPLLVLEQVMPLMPTFASRDDAREILDDVEATGELWPSDDFWRQPGATYLWIPGPFFPAHDTISIIDPATADSWTLDGRTITSTYTSHHDLRNGEVSVFEWDLKVGGTPIAEVNEERPVFDPCGSFEFTWFPERSEVLVSGVPRCG